MDVEKFRRSPVGTLVPIQGEHRGTSFDHFAFVPLDLPDSVDLTAPTLLALTEATASVGRLDGVGRRLPVPQLLVRPTTRREAVSTSALEGTYTTLPEVLESELLQDEATPSKDVDEVLGYVRASEDGFDRVLQGRPVTLNLIKDLHGALLRGDPEVASSDKGEFRRRQNFIGPQESRVEDSYFVPPPPGPDLEDGLHSWESWIHREDLPLLMRLALGHYQFETLHPFVDGNGRIGRLVCTLMLLEAGDLSQPLLSISPYLEARHDEYQRMLRETSASGDFDGWIRFFLLAIKVSADASFEKSEQLIALSANMVEALRAAKARGLSIQATEDLIGDPVTSPTRMARRYDVTYQAAVYTIRRMQRVGILHPVQVGKRTVYACLDVIRILEN